MVLRIPERINYNCQGCGRCCSGWSIGLTEEDYAKVKDVDWASLHPQLQGTDLFIHRQEEFAKGESAYPHFTKPSPSGTCSFLVDNLCFIHKHLGADQKPTVCQQFPYTFLQTPTGVYAGVTYASMAAAQNLGQPLSEQEAVLEEHWKKVSPLEEAKQVQQASAYAQVKLTEDVVVSWQEYLEIEEAIFRWVKPDETGNVFEMLLAGEEIILQAARLKRNQKSLDSLVSFQPDLKRLLSASTPGTLEKMILSMFYFRLPVYSKLKVEHLCLWRLDKNFWKSTRLLLSVGKALGALALGAMITIGWQRIETPSGYKSINECLKLPTDALDPDIERFFHRWLYLKIFSKSYFGPPVAGLSVLGGYQLLLLCFLCALVYSKGSTSQVGDRQITLASLFEIYPMLDRELMTLAWRKGVESNMYHLAFSIPHLFDRLIACLAQASNQGVSRS